MQSDDLNFIEGLNRTFRESGRRPEFVHLLSKSLPRSGHHHSAAVLDKLYGSAFEYCEFYQPSETDCCKRQPCRRFCSSERMRNGQRHVSMQKSHDYQLNDTMYVPNEWLKYVIMVRGFKAAVSSEVKLFLINHFAQFLAEHQISTAAILEHHDKALYRKALALIDENGLGLPAGAIVPFLNERFDYHRRFRDKWLRFARMHPQGTVLIHYDDLVGANRAAVIERLVDVIGIPPQRTVGEALAMEPLMTESERKMEASRAAFRLVEANRKLFETYDALLGGPPQYPDARGWH